MSNFTRADHATKWIPVKDISVVWAEAQRGLNEREAKHIADNFDPDAFGVITVTLPNGDGQYHCIDGQTRVFAVRAALGEDQSVPCNVLNATDVKRAADIFSKMNSGRSKPQALDRFRVAVTAGYEVESAVNKIVTSLGYSISGGSQNGAFAAVNTACTIYRRHGMEVLRDALLIIRHTWGKTREAVDGSIIGGYAALIAEFNLQIDNTRLVSKMQKAYTPAKLLGTAKSSREGFGGSTADCVKRILERTYNAGLRSGQLSDAAS